MIKDSNFRGLGKGTTSRTFSHRPRDLGIIVYPNHNSYRLLRTESDWRDNVCVATAAMYCFVRSMRHINARLVFKGRVAS
jgi:hypothetical protein